MREICLNTDVLEVRDMVEEIIRDKYFNPNLKFESKTEYTNEYTLLYIQPIQTGEEFDPILIGKWEQHSQKSMVARECLEREFNIYPIA